MQNSPLNMIQLFFKKCQFLRVRKMKICSLDLLSSNFRSTEGALCRLTSHPKDKVCPMELIILSNWNYHLLSYCRPLQTWLARRIYFQPPEFVSWLARYHEGISPYRWHFDLKQQPKKYDLSFFRLNDSEFG